MKVNIWKKSEIKIFIKAEETKRGYGNSQG